jgi:hypothetical protein
VLGQNKVYDNGFDVAVFQGNRVLLFMGHYYKCLADSTGDLDDLDTECVKARKSLIKPFRKQNLSLSEFNHYQPKVDISFQDIKDQIEDFFYYDLCDFLAKKGFSIVNVDYIREVEDLIELQYYNGRQKGSTFYKITIIKSSGAIRTIEEK